MLVGVGSHFGGVNMSGRYPMTIDDQDPADGDGDVGMFLYGTLPDETWGPTSAPNYPLGRTALAGAAAGYNGAPTAGVTENAGPPQGH